MENEKQYEEAIFKHHFKTKSMAGFLSITPWNETKKFKIEVGEIGVSDNKLKQVTQGFTEFLNVAAYLRSVVNNTADQVYMDLQAKSPATFTQYGGARNAEGQVVSRVVKIQPAFSDLENKKYFPGLGFMWKVGHFKGREGANGAIIPDMKSPIQQNSIKISRQTMEEISYLVDMHFLKVELGKA